MSEIVSVRVPEDVKKEMNQHKEINWSEVMRKALNKYLKKVRETETLAKSMKLKEKDLEEISKKVKRGIAEKHGIKSEENTE